MADPSPRIRFLETGRMLLADMTGPRFFGQSYRNVPTVDRFYTAPAATTQFPYACLVSGPGSQTVRLEQTGDALDQFRADLYGFIDGDDLISPEDWAQWFIRDCKLTLREALAPEGDFYPWVAQIDFGEEDITFDERHASFLLPLTTTMPDAIAA